MGCFFAHVTRDLSSRRNIVSVDEHSTPTDFLISDLTMLRHASLCNVGTIFISYPSSKLCALRRYSEDIQQALDYKSVSRFIFFCPTIPGESRSAILARAGPLIGPHITTIPRVVNVM